MNLVQRVGRSMLVNTAKAIGLDDLFLTGNEHPAFVGPGGRGASRDIADAYSSSWIAYACIAKQAKDISGVPLRVLRDAEDLESELPESDRLSRLIAKPHPGLTRNQMIQFIVTMLRLRGAFFLDFDDASRPTRIIPWRDPLYWSPKVNDESESVVGWEYRKSHKHFVRLPSEIVVGRQINPTDPWGWQSPLAAAADPLNIDRRGDHLNAQTLGQGGEVGPIYQTDRDLGNEKYDQLVHRIQMRSGSKGEPPRPLILTNGMSIVDPKFTRSDLQILQQQERSAEKICAIYGMSPALLFKDDTPNRATFETRRRIYWTETLLPIIDSIESALDEWTVANFGVYCRFDLTEVPAMRDDLLEQVKVAKVLHSMQIPVAAINERLGLGLDIEMIPGAADNLVASSLIPVSAIIDADYSLPAETVSADSSPQITINGTVPANQWIISNEIIRSRHKDAVAVIARGKARTSLEVRAEKAYRAQVLKYKTKALRAAKDADGDMGALRQKLLQLVEPMGLAMADAVQPYQRDAAVEGALSILDLVAPERMYGTKAADAFRKMPELPGDALDAIRDRRNYLKDYKSRKIIEKVFDDIERAAIEEDGPTAVDVGNIISHRFNVEVNQANLVGRQEVGTAFNASRFGTMKAQDFSKHEWLTAGDELVRGSNDGDLFSHIDLDGDTVKIGEQFENGLRYPQENGGEPGNTINCRCLTLPVVEG